MKTDDKNQNDYLDILIKSTAIKLMDIGINAGPNVIIRDNDSVVTTHLENGIKLAGFKSVSENTNDFGFYADIIGANESQDQKPTLRISGIIITNPDEKIETYNSVTINFDVAEDSINQIFLRDTQIEVSDIKNVINNNSSSVRDVRSSNQSSYNPETEERLGKFYNLEFLNDDFELTVNESGQERPSTVSELSDSLNEVLAFLSEASQ